MDCLPLSHAPSVSIDNQNQRYAVSRQRTSSCRPRFRHRSLNFFPSRQSFRATEVTHCQRLFESPLCNVPLSIVTRRIGVQRCQNGFAIYVNFDNSHRINADRVDSRVAHLVPTNRPDDLTGLEACDFHGVPSVIASLASIAVAPTCGAINRNCSMPSCVARLSTNASISSFASFARFSVASANVS